MRDFQRRIASPVTAAVAGGVLVVSPGAPVSAQCSGSQPSITSARVVNTAPDQSRTRYEVGVTVSNVGDQGQSSKTLQSVTILEDGIKVDQKGIPPLVPGKPYTFTYAFVRANDAGNGTTRLDFQLTGAGAACAGARDNYSLTV
jgi:hypothetical protein